MPEIKWKTITINVDVDTGEVIENKKQMKEYIITNKKKHYVRDNTSGTAEITNECKRTTQLKIFE